jgi:dipeptidyl aminopeptidase/acylaminoacyl peptidase
MAAEETIAGSRPDWRARFRAPAIRGLQIALQAPERRLVVSNATGVMQLHAWDVAHARLRQLTHAATGVMMGTLAADGRFVYYHEDDNGNEIGRYVRVAFAGGPPESVTPALAAYPTFGFATSGAGNRLGFVTADAGYRLYVVDVAASGELGAPRCIYHSERLLTAPIFSHDGTLVVISRLADAGSLRRGLLALHAETGDVRAELTEASGNLEHIAFRPLAGDQNVLISSNASGVERASIWDLATGARSDIDSAFEGDVYAHDWSPDGRAVLLVEAARAVQQLHLHDVETSTTVALKHPGGTYMHLAFADPNTLCAVWEDSTHPTQVITLGVGTSQTAHEQVAGPLLPVSEVPSNRPWRSISFHSSDGQEIQAWLAVPAGEGPFPTILHAHGGPEFAMTERYFPASQMWLDHGFVFMTVNYRGSTTFGQAFFEQIWGDLGHWEVEDLAAARAWLVEHGLADPARVFVNGESYGGYLTLQALGTKPGLWAGGIALSPVADWAIAQEDTTPTLRGLRAARFGGTTEQRPERYAKSSPITYAADVSAPVLAIHGRNDRRYPGRSLAVYEQRMKALGKDIELHWYDAGHGALALEQSLEHHELMLGFARRIADA